MCTLCDKCTFNNFGVCYKDKEQYLHVFDEDDCDEYVEDEDCGALNEDLGFGQDEP